MLVASGNPLLITPTQVDVSNNVTSVIEFEVRDEKSKATFYLSFSSLHRLPVPILMLLLISLALQVCSSCV